MAQFGINFEFSEILKNDLEQFCVILKDELSIIMHQATFIFNLALHHYNIQGWR